MRSFTIYIEDERTKSQTIKQMAQRSVIFGMDLDSTNVRRRRGERGRGREIHNEKERAKSTFGTTRKVGKRLTTECPHSNAPTFFPRQEGLFAKGAKSFTALSKCTRRLTT